MILNFDIKKAIASTAYLVEQQGGCEGMYILIKKLYWADRAALLKWGNSITGDSFSSLRKGPIVSGIYNLFKGQGRQRELILWNDVIVREGNSITIRKSSDKSILSRREIEVLEYSNRTINAVRSNNFQNWLHSHCPEWKDPGKSSKPIDPSEILRKEGKSEERIKAIEQANEEVRFVSYLLDAR